MPAFSKGSTLDGVSLALDLNQAGCSELRGVKKEPGWIRVCDLTTLGTLYNALTALRQRARAEPTRLGRFPPAWRQH
jgi:hypothetical protein